MAGSSPLIGRRPILVTGVPRSGTTWLARWLAGGRGVAMAGREPMNPRAQQYALAHTLDGWARLTELTPRQRRALRLAYRGANPFVYSRYGIRQWAAPLPQTRLVVKDPFALLSVPTIARHTGALTVIVYRHPGAVLASYRRMGWQPDVTELQGLVAAARACGGPQLPDLPTSHSASPAEVMGRFWATLHDLALFDIDRSGAETIVVAHQEIAGSGLEGGHLLAARLGVPMTDRMERELAREAGAGQASAVALHNLDRPPASVAEAWRDTLPPDEVDVIEKVTEETRSLLDGRRLVLSSS